MERQVMHYKTEGVGFMLECETAFCISRLNAHVFRYRVLQHHVGIGNRGTVVAYDTSCYLLAMYGCGG